MKARKAKLKIEQTEYEIAMRWFERYERRNRFSDLIVFGVYTFKLKNLL